MGKTRSLIVAAASAALLMAACSSTEIAEPSDPVAAGAETTAPRPSTTVEDLTDTAAEQCAAQGEDRIETVTMQFDGLERSYDIVAPASSEPLPVVIAFHGFTQSSELHREMTGLGDAALEQGFIAIFPMGSIPAGGTQPYFNLATTDDDSLADDIGLTKAILGDVISEHCVDETRVYATGWSNGGLFASTLACQIPGQFAAVASVSGVVLRDDCPDDPVPIIILHGTADTIVPYTDAPDGYMYDTVTGLGGDEAQAAMFAAVDEDPDDYILQWVDQNGCQTDAAEVGDSVHDILEYQGCDQGAQVETVILEFGGHRWTRYPTELILEFLSEHRLPAG